MKDARKSSFKTSMLNLVKAADNYYADNQLDITNSIAFDFLKGGVNEKGEELSFKGTKPKTGRLVINVDGEITLLDVSDGTYYANYNSSSDDDILVSNDNEVMTRDELTEEIKKLKEELKKTNTQLASTTTIANTANTTANTLNSTRLNKTYPVGSIYISYNNTNPGTLFGETWIAYATGRTLVGVDTSNTNFNTIGKTGGASSVTLTTSNLPSHTHSIPALSGSTSSNGAHTHSLNQADVLAYSSKNDGDIMLNNTVTAGNVRGTYAGNSVTNYKRYTDSNGAHTHTITTKASTTGANGSGSAVNNLQPYITVYMWRRTA